MKKVIKRGVSAALILALLLLLAACGSESTKADYTTKQAETALQKGKDLKDKTISIRADKLVPDSAFGYNIETGKHLNFVSENNPHIKKGQKVIVKVKRVTSQLGSFIITYNKIR
ncbi:hypothetical protein [Furfurilactobacillus curtus]|uniref:DUF3221 domain-containing protein n=1 Tax=Furfurilactobacillus curtus TaxID=1746200 RepID=A0ABQ5JLH5_9LACO